jgi:hypothetical protein
MLALGSHVHLVVASEPGDGVSWLWLLASAPGADSEEPFGHPSEASDPDGERQAAVAA